MQSLLSFIEIHRNELSVKDSSNSWITNSNIGTKAHVALTYNKTARTLTCWVNGNLAYIRSNYVKEGNYTISFDHGDSNNQIMYLAQLAVRSGDYSINNGQNFPVPTERYYS